VLIIAFGGILKKQLKTITQPLAQVRNAKISTIEGPEITLGQELRLHSISILVLVAGVEISDHMPTKMELDLLIPCQTEKDLLAITAIEELIWLRNYTRGP
jgi:hypothetical protein